jgi:hypothetical protein
VGRGRKGSEFDVFAISDSWNFIPVAIIAEPHLQAASAGGDNGPRKAGHHLLGGIHVL